MLVGLTVGKAWERYKLRAGRLIDRRRVPESLHYIVGLNFLVTNQIDLAIDELSKAAENLGDALEIHLLLGSLYREKGQVARAINIHQSLLQRPQLTRLEQAHMLLCLGLDFKRGGFVDRALEAFNEVIGSIRKISTRCSTSRSCTRISISGRRPTRSGDRSATRAAPRTGAARRFSRFSKTNSGCRRLPAVTIAGAMARFQSAIDLDSGVVPAYLNLGDIYARDDKWRRRRAIWEEVIEKAPERSYLTFDRLSLAYEKLGMPERFAQLLPAS